MERFYLCLLLISNSRTFCLFRSFEVSLQAIGALFDVSFKLILTCYVDYSEDHTIIRFNGLMSFFRIDLRSQLVKRSPNLSLMQLSGHLHYCCQPSWSELYVYLPWCFIQNNTPKFPILCILLVIHKVSGREFFRMGLIVASLDCLGFWLCTFLLCYSGVTLF